MLNRSHKNKETVAKLGAPLAAIWVFARNAMSNFSRLKWRYVVAVGVLAAAASVAIVGWQANRALEHAAQDARSASELRFTTRQLTGSNTSFEWISAPAAFSGGAVFNGKFYLAGATGLFEYDSRGSLIRHYRPGQELPPTTLVRITTAVLRDSREQELLLATADQGILAFNGSNFRQILPQDPDALSITSILPLSTGQLLIGTRKRGVLVYDGQTLQAFHPGLAALHVTELAGNEADLWIGTQDRGAIHFQAGRIETFSEAEGLPDRQVFSIATRADKAYVGTAAGIAEFQAGRFVRVLAPGIFARAVYAGDSTILAGGNGAGIAEIAPASTRMKGLLRATGNSIADLQQIFADGPTLYAVTSRNLYYKESAHSGWRRALSLESTSLTDRNISALAFDASRHLWIGYFDRGLDLLSPDLRNVTHIEDDNVFCVNRILPNPSAGSVAVATANGLVMFDQLGRKQQVLGRSDGLMADHVTDAALYRDGMVLATPAGLTFLDPSGPHSLYAFHGLVNNHVYTVAAAGKEVVAGTLGGISVLEDESVAANYTVATHGLTHNWISAMVRDGNDWIVGTYGGGIVRLLSSGRFEAFDIATGKFEVYPNAMLATEHHVLAGTLGKGLYVYNRSSNHWTVITDGLPSLTVTALTSGNGYIYVGTDNGLVRIAEQNLP
jgi:ligand-binding sensor domain-containing protein